MSEPGKRDKTAFLILCAACVLATIAFGVVVAQRSRRPASTTINAAPKVAVAEALSSESFGEAARSEVKTSTSGGKSLALKPAPKVRPASPLMFFRATALGPNYGKLSVATLDALDQPRYAAELSCDRVHFAGDRGVCTFADRGLFNTFDAAMFDEHLQRGWSITLDGIPSRVRVSPNGRLAAVTVFLSGHSYADLKFSTRTTILNAANGEILADLDKFSVWRDDAIFQSSDFNFWGVTFAHDENRFYATLWSKGKTYLVEGDLARRTARVTYEGVECPSLSPDNTRITFKKRISTPPIDWQIHLLDLATLTETPLGETRSVDDQVEWLDDEHILYTLSENEKGSSATDIWVLPARADGAPRLLYKGGYSPAVVANQAMTSGSAQDAKAPKR